MKFKLIVSYYGMDEEKEGRIRKVAKRPPWQEEYDPEEGRRTLVFYFGAKRTASACRSRLMELKRAGGFTVSYVQSEVWDG